MPLYQNNFSSITTSGDVNVNGTLTAFGYLGAGGNVGLGSGVSQIGFYGATPVSKPTVTGSRANTEAALKSLLDQLTTMGLFTNTTSA